MSNGRISEEAVDAAFHWLLSSSEEIAAARGNKVRKEYLAKRVFARMFKHADGNIEMKKAIAMDSEEYAAAMEDVAIAEETWERASDQRNRAQIIIEVWRTSEASQRSIQRLR